MKRRIALLAGAGLSLATATTAHAQSTGPTGKERVVIQVSTPEQRLWNQAFNYLANLREVYGNGNVELEIVALGMGIGVLQFESTQGPRIAEALQAGVHVSACEISMRRQKLKREDMLPNIGFVPAGLGQIIKRQREGWAYISG